MEKKDGPHLDRELELSIELCNEIVVRQRLAHLHDTHNGCIHLVLAVLEHPLRGTGVFLLL